MEPKNVTVSVNEGDVFFSNEASINFNPLQFVFDFKSVTPRVDLRNKDGASISIKHNVVIVDPWHAKQIHNLFSQVLQRYEKEFGEITKPEALAKFEEKMPKEGDKKGTNVPTYFG